MNTKFLALAIASLVSIGAARDCSPNELDKYAALKLSPNFNACQGNSGGFDFFKPTGFPTNGQLVLMCPLPACHNLIKELLGYNIADCVIDKKLNVMFLAFSFEPACSHLPPAPTTAAPAPTTTISLKSSCKAETPTHVYWRMSGSDQSRVQSPTLPHSPSTTAMNTKFLALAIASVAVATVSANDATCPNTEITKLGRLALSANLQSCQDQSGYAFVPPSALPNAEQQAKLCASKECNALIKEVIALDPSDCKILGILNVRELVFGFDATCAALAGTPAPAATTATPAAGTPAPAAGTPVPAATKPVC